MWMIVTEQVPLNYRFLETDFAVKYLAEGSVEAMVTVLRYCFGLLSSTFELWATTRCSSVDGGGELEER